MVSVQWVGSPNHYNGRQGRKVTHITLHIMVGYLAGTDATFAKTSSNSSAHYGIGADGTIHQYVKESDGSFSDANRESNLSTISIEHEGGMANGAVCTAACVEASAQLCADIARRYGWTRLWNDGRNGNVWLHREIPGTDHVTCPDLAPNGLPYQTVINRANELLGGTDMPAKTDPVNYGNQNVTVEYALQDICHKLQSILDKTDGLGKRLGPVADDMPFDYLPAILNNTNTLFEAIGDIHANGMTDDQLTSLANSLKNGLGAEVAAELAKRLQA